MAEELPVGIGELTGDPIVTGGYMHLTGQVWYVGGTTIGVDAASPAGLNRTKPLATVTQALTNAATGDVIVMLDGVIESLPSFLSVSKGVTIVGAGSSNGLPTAGFQRGGATTLPLTISAAGVQLRNLSFPASVVTSPDELISVSAAGFVMKGCHVDCGTSDNHASLELASGADDALIEDTTFISSGTFATGPVYDLPVMAIKVGAALSRLTLRRVTLNGGSYGFSNPWALDASAAAQTLLRAEQMTLLNGADVTIESSSTGYFHVDQSTSDGSSKVVW